MSHFKKTPTQSLSRWHGVTGGTTVGGDVHTTTIGTVATIITVTVGTVTTATRAADRCGVSDDSASGAQQGARFLF